MNKFFIILTLGLVIVTTLTGCSSSVDTNKMRCESTGGTYYLNSCQCPLGNISYNNFCADPETQEKCLALNSANVSCTVQKDYCNCICKNEYVIEVPIIKLGSGCSCDSTDCSCICGG